MQSDNKFLDDITKATSSALGTIFNVTKEVDSFFKKNMESILASMDVVPREEFEAVKEIAVKARTRQAELEAKIAELEKRLAVASTPAPAPKKATPKPAANPAAAKAAPAKAAPKPVAAKAAPAANANSRPAVKKKSTAKKPAAKKPAVTKKKSAPKKVAKKKA